MRKGRNSRGHCITCHAKSHKRHKAFCRFGRPTTPPVTITPPFLQEKKKAITKNNLVILLDRSGSMALHETQGLSQKVVNDQISAAKSASFDNKIATYLTLVEFDHHQAKQADNAVIQAFGHFNLSPGFSGWTNIWDAFFYAISNLDLKIPTLFVLISDGLHNYGGVHSVHAFQNRLQELQASGLFTFSVVGPQSVVEAMKQLGVEAGNTMVWAGDAHSFINKVSPITSRAIGQTYSGYSKGVQMSSNFYAEVKDTKAIGKLEDVSGFTQHLVNSCLPISDFVKKVKGAYRTGDALYELTKPEKIQAYKQIIVQDRKTGELKGGPNVRAALGLPAKGDPTVHPGNLQGFKAFVESTSVNRKLVPGTSLLVRN